jgi:hypothetical protein
MTALRRPRTRPLQCKLDMTRPPSVADQPQVSVLVAENMTPLAKGAGASGHATEANNNIVDRLSRDASKSHAEN